MAYLLIPLDEAIVFPTVTATLPIDVGEEERVFLLPRRDGEFGRVGVVAEVIERGRSRRGAPGRDRGRPAPRASPAPPRPGEDADALRVEVQEIHDGHPDDEHTARAGARVPRRGRGDPRAARRRRPHRRLPALGRGARRAGRHLRPQPRHLRRGQAAPAGDDRRHRPPASSRSSCSASGWPSCRCAARSATTSSPAPRSSSASTSCANRWSRSARSWARTRPT